jgi:hypothetical protein
VSLISLEKTSGEKLRVAYFLLAPSSHGVMGPSSLGIEACEVGARG